jgi:IS5 family transposase
VSDVKAAPALLERAGPMHYLLGDKGYDVNGLRKSLRENGTSTVIPDRGNRKRVIRSDQQRYRGPAPYRKRFLPYQGFSPDRHSL